MSGRRAILKAKRRTRAEVQKLVEKFRRSGMRRIDFFRERRLSLRTLARHLRTSKEQDLGHKKRTTVTKTLVRVEIVEGKRSSCTLDSGVVVVLSGGHRVEVQVDFDVPTLHRLLTALEPACHRAFDQLRTISRRQASLPPTRGGHLAEDLVL
jgi:hypothetical protein